MSTLPIKIVYSFSDKDIEHLKEIKKTFIGLKWVKTVEHWDRTEIIAGEEKTKVVKQKFYNADIIFLLISADYLDFENDPCILLESQAAQANLKRGYSTVIPIKLKPTGGFEDYLNCYFGNIKSLPEEKTLTNSNSSYDESLKEIFESIKSVLLSHQRVKRKNISIFSTSDIIESLKRKFFNQFEDLKKLKSGALLTVIKAKDKWLGRNVTIKVINPWIPFGEAEIMAQLKEAKREISAFSNYRHRNIKTIYFGSLSEELNYVVLEYINGCTLQEILEIEGKQPVWEVKKILLHLMDALYYGHQRGLVHNYINPTNIYIDEEFVPVISPFKILNTSHFIGEYKKENLTYWSPEMLARHGEISEESDQFSIGLIAYELLVGEALFLGETEEEILSQRKEFKKDKTKFIAKLNENGVPDGLISILLKMLADKKEDRHDNLGKAWNELNQLEVDLHSDVRIVLESYRRSCAASPNLIETFYNNLFEEIPEAKQYFVNTPWELQYFKFHHSINALLQIASKTDHSTLKKVAVDHQHRQIPQFMYDKFGEIIMDTISKYDKMWMKEDDIKNSWEKLLSSGIQFMTESKDKK